MQDAAGAMLSRNGAGAADHTVGVMCSTNQRRSSVGHCWCDVHLKNASHQRRGELMQLWTQLV